MERVGKTRVAVRDGMAQVRLGSALPPGRYRWRVERSLDNRVVAKVGPRPLTLLGPRLSRLRVHAVSRSYKSSRNPGHTRLKISASPYASLRITFARSGRKRVLRYGLDRSSHGTVRIDWTRRVRGAGHYRWTVQASDGYTARIASAYRANRDELNVAASSPTR